MRHFVLVLLAALVAVAAARPQYPQYRSDSVLRFDTREMPQMWRLTAKSSTPTAPAVRARSLPWTPTYTLRQTHTTPRRTPLSSGWSLGPPMLKERRDPYHPDEPIQLLTTYETYAEPTFLETVTTRDDWPKILHTDPHGDFLTEDHHTILIE